MSTIERMQANLTRKEEGNRFHIEMKWQFVFTSSGLSTISTTNRKNVVER